MTEPTLSRGEWSLALVVIVVLCVLVGWTASTRLPLDSHEIFVAQTAREMSQRGDWVVPYFNGEPRLNKPPLSYWAAGAVANILGDLPEVPARAARLVSVGAGIGFVGATLATGWLLFGATTGLLAAVLLISSAGLFTFMHDARPDMLYALWTACMLLGATWSMRRPLPRGTRFFGGVGLLWISFAAATLTKGPHVPALVLLGWAWALRLETGSWRAVNACLQPLPGVVLAAVLTLPWWLLLEARLSLATVGGSQLGGSLLTPALTRLLNPYYLYRPLQLLLPWLPLVLLGLVVSLKPAQARARRFLLLPLLTLGVGLTLGPQARYFYVLPLLGLLALWVAHAVVASGQDASARRLAQNLVLPLQGVLVLACAGWVIVHAGNAWTTVSGWLVAAAIAGIITWRSLARRTTASAYFALAVAMALVWPAAALTGAVWNQERFDNHQLALRARARVDALTPLATLRVSPTVYVYYTGRRVSAFTNLDQLEPALSGAPNGSLALITREADLVELNKRFAVHEMGRYRSGDSHEVLVRLQARGTP